MTIEERLREKIQDFMIMCRFQEAVELDSELSDLCGELNAEIIKPAIKDERESCAKIVHEEYLAYTEGGFSASQCFVDAEKKILARARSDEKPP